MKKICRISPMDHGRLVILILLVLVSGVVACAQRDATPTSDQLTSLSFDQKLNAQLSMDLSFHDENGRAAELRTYFDGKPVVLVLGYYQCPMLCNLSLNGLVEALQQIRGPLARESTVIFVSIDPTETPALALAKKRMYLKRYGRPGAESSWHFLIGRETSLRQLADEVGFHYAYHSDIKQYAHPSGIVILTPEGRVSQYLLGVSYSARDLNAALIRAASNQTGSRVQQLLMLCSQFMPLTGKYSGIIMWAVRLLAVGTILGLMVFLVAAWRRQRKTQALPVN